MFNHWILGFQCFCRNPPQASCFTCLGRFLKAVRLGTRKTLSHVGVGTLMTSRTSATHPQPLVWGGSCGVNCKLIGLRSKLLQSKRYAQDASNPTNCVKSHHDARRDQIWFISAFPHSIIDIFFFWPTGETPGSSGVLEASRGLRA